MTSPLKGTGVVMVDLPEAVSVTLVGGGAKITWEGDGAALPPFGVATSVPLQVVILFDDGSSRDVSLDPRTVFTLTLTRTATRPSWRA